VAINRPAMRAVKETGSSRSRQLVSGEPWLGAMSPEGPKFLGWVLVQVWEPQDGRNCVTLHWSGDQAIVLPAALSELQNLRPEL
jgi:hypothetical protein